MVAQAGLAVRRFPTRFVLLEVDMERKAAPVGKVVVAAVAAADRAMAFMSMARAAGTSNR